MSTKARKARKLAGIPFTRTPKFGTAVEVRTRNLQATSNRITRMMRRLLLSVVGQAKPLSPTELATVERFGIHDGDHK